MPLPTLTWRAFAPVALAANNVPTIMDAIYNNGLAATYADGSARPAPGTVGSTSWTWAREQSAGTTVSTYGTPPPPASGVVVPTQYIVAGATSLPPSGPTMATPNGVSSDTNAVNRLNVAMVKNPGAFIGGGTGWYAANPFTSGTFSGYAVTCPATTVVTYAILRMWECQEAFIIQLQTAGGAAAYMFGAGAFIDPLSSDARDAESDGRLYSVFTTNTNAAMTQTFLSDQTANASGPFIGRTTANQCRFFSWWPVVSPTYLNSVTRYTSYSGPTSSFVSPNGELPKIPFPVMWIGATSSFGGPSAIAGQLRQIYVTRGSLAGTTWTNGANIVGYIIAYSSSTGGNSLVLTY